MNLILPGRLDDFRLQLETEGVSEKEIRFKLEFEHWLLKLFTPMLYLTYDPTIKKTDGIPGAIEYQYRG